ncbi:MAG TPA: hypothetical protein VIP98_03780 [Microlunatus sp.]
MAFSPDSRWLFVLSSDRKVYGIDVATGRARLVFPQLSGVSFRS